MEHPVEPERPGVIGGTAMHPPSGAGNHLFDHTTLERLLVSLAVTTPMGAMIADLTLRVFTTILVTVATSIAMSILNAVAARVAARVKARVAARVEPPPPAPPREPPAAG